MSEITNTPAALLRPRDVFKRVALSRTTIWRRVREGSFPTPVNLGPKRIAWREADIVAWIEAQQPTKLAAPAAAESQASKAAPVPVGRSAMKPKRAAEVRA